MFAACALIIASFALISGIAILAGVNGSGRASPSGCVDGGGGGGAPAFPRPTSEDPLATNCFIRVFSEKEKSCIKSRNI